MDDCERLFNYWLTELRQRESSNTTVVAITGSASLIMLVLFVDFLARPPNIEEFWILKLVVIGAGIALSILGIVYRELSKYIIHERQILELKKLMKPEDRKKVKELGDHADRHNNWMREATWRGVMLTPVISWVMLILASSIPGFTLGGLLILITIPVLYCYDKKRKSKSVLHF